mgnify:FL=1
MRLRRGSASGAADATDLPLLRDPLGRPLIPGSSLKGVLRSSAERLLRGIRQDLACDILAKDYCLAGTRTPSDEQLETLCWTCRLFGNPAKAGRLVCFDLVADQDRTIVRDGVAIDRAELKAKHGAKFDYEVCPPGTVFRGRIRLDDPEPGDVGLLAGLLDLMDAGLITVGGGVSRGLGQLRYRIRPTFTQIRAATFVPTAAPAPVDLDRERRAFGERLEGSK